MAAIRLTCSNCKGTFPSEAAVGSQVVCPLCGQSVTAALASENGAGGEAPKEKFPPLGFSLSLDVPPESPPSPLDIQPEPAPTPAPKEAGAPAPVTPEVGPESLVIPILGEPPPPPVTPEVVVSPPPPDMTEWFLARDNQRYGPYPSPHLRKMVDAGQVQPNDLVWKEGMATWVEAQTVRELFPHGAADQGLVPVMMGDAPRPRYAASGAGRFFQPGEYGGAAEFWSNLWVMLRRAFGWDLRRMPVTDREKKHLKALGVNNPEAQQYFGWRRSVLLLVAVATCLSALLDLILTLTKSYEGRTGLFVFAEVIRLLSQFTLPATAILACVFWSRLRLSRNLMLAGWAVSFFVPIAIALIPNHLLYDFTGQLPAGQRLTEVQQKALESLLGIVGGLYHYIMLMPAVLSLVPGVLRACIRLKSLLPASILPGWFLVTGTPLYMLLLLVTFVTLNQIAGNALLILGLLLLIGSPVVYLVGARLYVRPLTTPGELRTIRFLQIIPMVVGGLAALLLIIFVMTKEVFGKKIVGFSSETSFFLPWKILQFYVEFLGRSYFTSTLVADLLMMINLSVWTNWRRFSKTETADEYDRLMAEFHQALHPLELKEG
jgi:hypothetical protein